jgi:hypothetical protein
VLTLAGISFTRGRSTFSDQGPGRQEPTAKVYVKVHFEGLEEPILAQVDTGAAWSVLAPEVARRIGVSASSSEQPASLRTHLGIWEGHLVRLPFTFVADEGESLLSEGVFFVCSDCPPGWTFLGYSGLLDSIRFALDPQANHFYFGAS